MKINLQAPNNASGLRSFHNSLENNKTVALDVLTFKYYFYKTLGIEVRNLSVGGYNVIQLVHFNEIGMSWSVMLRAGHVWTLRARCIVIPDSALPCIALQTFLLPMSLKFQQEIIIVIFTDKYNE